MGLLFCCSSIYLCFRTIGDLETEHSLLNQILTFERNSIAELLLLMNVGVAPFAEYTMFRRDYQAVVDAATGKIDRALLDNYNNSKVGIAAGTSADKDRDNGEGGDNSNNDETDSRIQHFSILEYELQITQKKAMLLRTRRLDEERGLIASDLRYSMDTAQNSSGGLPSPTKSGGASRRPPRDSTRF